MTRNRPDLEAIKHRFTASPTVLALIAYIEELEDRRESEIACAIQERLDELYRRGEISAEAAGIDPSQPVA